MDDRQPPLPDRGDRRARVTRARRTMNTKAKLVHALTQHDIRQSSRKCHNPYALAHYLRLADDIAEAIDKGEAPRAAACSRCHDRVLAVVLRALGEPAPTAEEARG